MTEQTAYRIIEVKRNTPHTLFHGISGQRAIPTGTWVKADKKLVRDGTGPWYMSGFNILLDQDDCLEYVQRFKAPRELRVVEIKVRGELREKRHSRSNVLLADEMWLDWPQTGW